jgi:hypothetical protein
MKTVRTAGGDGLVIKATDKKPKSQKSGIRFLTIIMRCQVGLRKNVL